MAMFAPVWVGEGEPGAAPRAAVLLLHAVLGVPHLPRARREVRNKEGGAVAGGRQRVRVQGRRAAHREVDNLGPGEDKLV